MSLAHYTDYVQGDQEQELDVKQFWSILRKRRATFIQVFIVVLVAGIGATLLSKPLYQTKAELLVPAGSPTVSLVNSDNPLAPLFAAGSPDSVSTQIQVLQSGPFLADAKKAAGIGNDGGVIPPTVKVEAVKDTNVIRITVEGGSPSAIATLANAIVKLHLENTDTLRTTGLQDSLRFVREQVHDAETKLQTASRKLLDFRNTHPVLQLDADQDSRLKGYMELQTQAMEAQSNLASTRAQLRDVQARLARLPADQVRKHRVENPQRALLQDKLRQLTVQRLDLLQDFLPESEEVKAIDEKIASYTGQLKAEPETLETTTYAANPLRDTLEAKQAELESSLARFQEGLNSADAQLQAQKLQIGSTGPWKFTLDELTQGYDRAKARYSSLSDRLQDLEIRKNARGQQARIIQLATAPTRPIQPKPLLNVALSLILGLFLAAGVVFLQEYLDDRINEPDDLERLAGLPSLGHVPVMTSEQPRLVTALPSNSHISEAYRTIRSSIGFAGLDGPIRRLQVTSASKGEGKTLTSVNLATAMAMDGKKVILVDADLRRPTLHRVLQLTSSPGLSELLVGQKRWPEVIQDTDIPNLRVITAGAVPPNPAELLGTRAFDQTVEALSQQADIVIFDTPPCMPVTDPLIVASRMDGVVLVVNTGQTRRAAVRYMVGMLGRTRTRVLGAIFNRVDTKKGGYYYHYYYHYYGDGYYSDGAGRNGHKTNGHLPSTASTASTLDDGPIATASRPGLGDSEE